MSFPTASTSLQTDSGVDRLELNLTGQWNTDRFWQIAKLPTGKQTLCGKQVRIYRGGTHGCDFYPVAIQRFGRYRIEPFKDSRNGFAARLTIYSAMLTQYGAKKSFRFAKRYLETLGLNYEDNQVSRLDLRCDINLPFSSFQKRLLSEHYVTRCKQHNLDGYPSTLYFGKVNIEEDEQRRPRKMKAVDLALCIYNKGLQRGLSKSAWTRVEFQLKRRWLKTRNMNTWEETKPKDLWDYLTSKWLRITTEKPKVDQQWRCETWNTWKRIQRVNTFN